MNEECLEHARTFYLCMQSRKCGRVLSLYSLSKLSSFSQFMITLRIQSVRERECVCKERERGRERGRKRERKRKREGERVRKRGGGLIVKNRFG
jgi:hypothetical protein